MSAESYTIGILGTGPVARTLARRLGAAGHAIVLGSRDPAAVDLPNARVVPLAEAAAAAQIVVNATPGRVSLDVFGSIDEDALAGKILVDVGNAVEHAEDGRRLRFGGTSLAERLQERHPRARVVETLNTVHTSVMEDPAAPGGPTVMFVSGDDAEAKRTVTDLLVDMGWREDAIIDLGGITAARGQEAYLLLLNDLIRAIADTDAQHLRLPHAASLAGIGARPSTCSVDCRLTRVVEQDKGSRTFWRCARFSPETPSTSFATAASTRLSRRRAAQECPRGTR